LRTLAGYSHQARPETKQSVAAYAFGVGSRAAQPRRSSKQLPAGTAYAVWTGIGLVGSVVLGIALFGDSASPMRIACLALVVLGMVGLRWLEA